MTGLVFGPHLRIKKMGFTGPGAFAFSLSQKPLHLRKLSRDHCSQWGTTRDTWIPASKGDYGDFWYLWWWLRIRLYTDWKSRQPQWASGTNCSPRKEINGILKCQLCKRYAPTARGKTSGTFVKVFIFVKVLLTFLVNNCSWTYKDILRKRSKCRDLWLGCMDGPICLRQSSDPLSYLKCSFINHSCLVCILSARSRGEVLGMQRHRRESCSCGVHIFMEEKYRKKEIKIQYGVTETLGVPWGIVEEVGGELGLSQHP